MTQQPARENTNVTTIQCATEYAPGGSTTRHRCNGCGDAFSAHGIRAHQSARFVTAACRPMWVAT